MSISTRMGGWRLAKGGCDMSDNERLLTDQEMVERLGYGCVRTLLRRVADGQLPRPAIPGAHGRGRRWRWSDVERHLDRVKQRVA